MIWNNKQFKIAFFGTPIVAVYVLDELKNFGILPDIIITAPDKPVGRKLVFTPPPAKVWAKENKIQIEQPYKISNLILKLKTENYDLFIVAAYGKILPKELLDIPKYGTLNMHPSLLPRLRGASPIQSAVLEEDETGVSIMLMDEKMDHGPIIAQEKVKFPNWPPKASELEEILARQGGRMLAEIIPKWISGKISAKDQNHNKATYCEKIVKEDGLIDLKDDTKKNYRKIQAFNVWPRAYFSIKKRGKKIRAIITDAEFKNNKLIIKKIIPEGKKEMLYEDFTRNC